MCDMPLYVAERKPLTAKLLSCLYHCLDPSEIVTVYEIQSLMSEIFEPMNWVKDIL